MFFRWLKIDEIQRTQRRGFIVINQFTLSLRQHPYFMHRVSVYRRLTPRLNHKIGRLEGDDRANRIKLDFVH